MANVWYIGEYDVREVFGQRFDKTNGWSIPESAFTGSQLTQLNVDSNFLLGQSSGPRVKPFKADSINGPDAYLKAMQDTLAASEAIQAAIPGRLSASTLDDAYGLRPEAVFDASDKANGSLPSVADTGQSMTVFGNSPFSISNGKMVHTPSVANNNAAYAQIELPTNVEEVVVDAEFPSNSTGAIAIVVPSDAWANGSLSAAGVHFVLYGNGNWNMGYWTGSGVTGTKVGRVGDMKDGKPKQITLRIDRANSTVYIMAPTGEVIIYTAATVPSQSSRWAIVELYEGVQADVPAKILRFSARSSLPNRFFVSTGDLAQRLGRGLYLATSTVAELTSETANGVDIIDSYNSTIRATVDRPPSGRVAVRLEAHLNITSATRVFFRCGQDIVGGSSAGVDGSTEELEAYVSTAINGRRSAMGIVNIPNGVGRCDIVGSISRYGGSVGSAKYMLENATGRKVRMIVTPIN
ncbi:lipase [Gordonia phage GretelLyn]|uniref:Lipase n=2 Tax=Lambovirus sadboi TaxID=2844674 RepID=A0A5J6TB71_9CAUD|nr:lipase [Gordonia phage Sadboi]QFG08146.1 lipase [Gordonia phage GretelLyn]QFG14656.1 lipase [Gordonia phage Sadboi]